MAHNPCSSNEFMPTDTQLIHFLTDKINGIPLPKDATDNIFEYDLHDTDKNPWEIWEAFGGTTGRDLFFFTPKKTDVLSDSGSGLVRAIGLGTWEDPVTKWAVNKKKRHVAMKRYFHFDNCGTNHDGAWTLHEYSIHPSIYKKPPVRNYVLCRLIKNQTDIQQDTGQEEITQSSVNGQVQAENGEELEDGDASTCRQQWQSENINQEYSTEEEEIILIPNTFYKDLLELDLVGSEQLLIASSKP